MADIAFIGDSGNPPEGEAFDIHIEDDNVSLGTGDTVAFDGSTLLSKVIEGDDKAKVYEISLINRGSLLGDYCLRIDAQGPEGVFSGAFYLYLEDETGCIYSKKIINSTRDIHTIDYTSKKPNIVGIVWSNKPIEPEMSKYGILLGFTN